jgi:hypothetical protein
MKKLLTLLLLVLGFTSLWAQSPDAAAEVQRIGDGMGEKLEALESDHFLFALGIPRTQAQPSVQAAEGAWKEFETFSGVQDAGELFGSKKPLVGLFAAKTGYDKFAEWYGATYKPWPGFVDNVKRAVFWPQPHPRIATFTHLKPNTPESVRNVIAHEVGHLLIMRWKYHNNFLPAWLEEGFACWIEAKSLGRSNCFCFAGGYGDRATRLDKINDIEWPRWKSAVALQVKGKHDKALKSLIPMTLSDLSAAEMGKAWSLVDWMVAQADGKFLKFVERMKANWPKDIVFEHSEAKGLAQEKALQEVFGLDAEGVDDAWRKWVSANYKILKDPARK